MANERSRSAELSAEDLFWRCENALQDVTLGIFVSQLEADLDSSGRPGTELVRNLKV